MLGDGICPTTGKVMRLSVEWARVAAFLASRRFKQRLQPYKCPDCETWHLRNRTKADAKRAGRRVSVIRVLPDVGDGGSKLVPTPPPPPPWGTPQLHDLLQRLGRTR